MRVLYYSESRLGPCTDPHLTSQPHDLTTLRSYSAIPSPHPPHPPLQSHYSVMFSEDVEAFEATRDGKVDRSFDLYYWDSLANQDEVIKLTVTPNTQNGECWGVWFIRLADPAADPIH